MNSEKLLIIRFSALGDVAMLVPVVKILAQQYPALQITVLSKPFAKFLFENLAPNVHFMSADVKKEYKGIKGLRRLYRRLFAKHFTHIADCHDVLRTKFLRMQYYYVSHKKTAHINKHRSLRRKLVSKKPVNTGKLPTAFENYAEVFAELGFPISLESQFKIKHLTLNIKNIGIAPFAAHQGKIYPMDKMKNVVEMIIKEHPETNIYFFGSGEKEFSEIEKLIDSHQQCHNASKECGSLDKELEMIKKIDVMLTMDSANMHLASMVGTRVVSIWGATHHYAGFLGWGQSEEDIVSLDLPCRPCSIYGNKKCIYGDYRCMKINEKLIIDKIFMHKNIPTVQK